MKLTLDLTAGNLLINGPPQNLSVVPYGSTGNIGVLELDDEGRTVRQLAFYEARHKQWFVNNGRELDATEAAI